MKQQIQLQIPEPCHENWDKMTATQQGRFCMLCQKEVVDFSVMTDAEILYYLSTASSKTCGRVDDSQLNRVLASPQQKRKYSFKYAWSVLISSVLLATEAQAQGTLRVDSAVALPVDRPTRGEVVVVGKMAYQEPVSKAIREISGTIADQNNEPLSFASVIIYGTKTGVATDADGHFTITVKNGFKNVKLVVSSVGYITQIIDCNNYDQVLNTPAAEGKLTLKIGLTQLKPQTMGEVVVTRSSSCRRTTGLMSVITKVSGLTAINTNFKDTLGINQIKSYPNPIASNTEFQLRYKLKETGEYQLRFTDALGRIVSSSLINIVSNNQTASFNAGILGGNGIYFASISNKKTGKTYTTRLLLQ